MAKILKIVDQKSLQLENLINALEKIGCTIEERNKACKIFEIYLDEKAEI